MAFILRWVFAFLLLAATYNPTNWNYIGWASANYGTQLPLVALFGLLLVVAYIVYISATLRSIGLFGMALVLAVFGAILWVLWDQGWLSIENRGLNTWIGLFALSLVLAIGMFWSILWRRMTGQVDVDETDP